MYFVCFFFFFLGLVSIVESALLSNLTVFTGEVIKVNEDSTISVQFTKNLLNGDNVKIPSTITLQTSDKLDESLTTTKGVFIFHAVPLGKEIFELLHYWSVKNDDFNDKELNSFEGRVCFLLVRKV